MITLCDIGKAKGFGSAHVATLFRFLFSDLCLMQSIFIMMRNHLTFFEECYDTLSSNSFFIGFGVFKRTYRDFQMALLQLKTLNLLCKRYLYDFIFVFSHY
jgi:hypothetical protein